MEAMLMRAFGKWNTKPQLSAKIVAPVPVRGKRLLLIDKPDATQTFYRIGNVGVARTNKDRIAIDLINTLFGGRFTRASTPNFASNRLDLRRTLTFDERLAPGPFFINTYTRNEATEQAIDKTLDILKTTPYGRHHSRRTPIRQNLSQRSVPTKSKPQTNSPRSLQSLSSTVFRPKRSTPTTPPLTALP
jgi:predicted Zn-dependent peptidase